MRQKPGFFGEVREEGRKRWNQLEADEELGGAWWLLFKQIQNPRHVLSELLQNADDSGATEAYACVEDGCFVFRHNGHDFSPDEFRSLCRFGFSNKRTADAVMWCWCCSRTATAGTCRSFVPSGGRSLRGCLRPRDSDVSET